MSGPVRSLNLSNAVAIVLYEALRQTRKESLAADERSGRFSADTDKTEPQQFATDERG
jgi:tRNA C32,U32 (ribose-2'-O)-methylase TrmJ